MRGTRRATAERRSGNNSKLAPTRFSASMCDNVFYHIVMRGGHDMSGDQHLLPVPSGQSMISRIAAKFRETFPEVAAKQAAAWLLALISFAGIWLWGWIVGGGLTRIVGAVPSGAVVAFSTPCRADQGWKEYGQAAGRFVIGANLDQRNGLKNRLPTDPPGGHETITLTTSQLPSLTVHSEPLKLVNLTDTGNSVTKAIVRTPANVGQTTIESTSDPGVQQQTIDNMPPYVALYYCEKN
jgi:hypothetical protein